MGTSKQMGPGCMMLFALPFLLTGLGVAAWGVHSWMLYARSGSWQKVPATVQSVEFVEHTDSDGDTTYSVKATYQYTVNGEAYTGHRVGVMGGSSSSYGMHHRRYAELKAAHDSGKPVTALVDPKDPAEALLYREKETWLLVMIPFGLVFAGAGVLMMGLGISALRRGRKLADIAATDANRLWDARSDWAAGRVRASTVKDMAVYWGFGIGISVFMSVFVIAMAKEDAPLFAKIIIGLFCLVAAFLVLKAVTLTVRVLAQGTPELFLSEVPIVPGRTVLAAVRTHRPLEADRWQVRLRCFVPAISSNSSAPGAGVLLRAAPAGAGSDRPAPLLADQPTGAAPARATWRCSRPATRSATSRAAPCCRSASPCRTACPARRWRRTAASPGRCRSRPAASPSPSKPSSTCRSSTRTRRRSEGRHSLNHEGHEVHEERRETQ